MRPAWSHDSPELFYLAPTGAVMRVGVERGRTWSATVPTKLFEGPYLVTGSGTFTGRTYDVSPDGRRFLMIKQSDGAEPNATTSLVVVQHWFEELKARVPTK
jgi:Tol biopolymer transport system component